MALFIIWKYEGLKQVKCDGRESQEYLGCNELCDDDVWRPCLQEIHPFWLLSYRVFAFTFTLASNVFKVDANGGGIFYYYTQWTFTLVTIYFGVCLLIFFFQSFVAMFFLLQRPQYPDDCMQYDFHLIFAVRNNALHLRVLPASKDEQRKALNPQETCDVSQAACLSTYLSQVIFQMNAGAVMLTDFIYWSIIYPFLIIKDYNWNFMTVKMHTLNVILLLGDTALNCLVNICRFSSCFMVTASLFIITALSYIYLSIYLSIFQLPFSGSLGLGFLTLSYGRVLMSFFSGSFMLVSQFGGPYPFLDLSSPNAPLWYCFLAFMHLPCYGLFALIVNTRHYLLSKWFPQSYRCLR
ncbi:hypothetical protein CRYUN_Cryun15aG0020400 [Craigia yunnanensis]